MPAPRAQSGPPSPGPRTILIVDDDREVQRFLAERFEREGWRAVSERDGDWALRAFERRHVDAVVLDILIPVMNGFQVAEKIRQHPRGGDVGLVMLTGIYRGPRHRAEAIEKYGLLDYLDKPVDADRLLEVLRTHFARLPERAETSFTPPPAAKAPRLVDDQQRRERKEVERATRTLAGELRGNLRRVPFPRLLADLHRQKRSGGLFLLRDKLKKIVYFRAGHPIFVKSNVLDECLGRVLVRERMISEDECESSVKRMKKDQRQQGSVLIEMGVISPHNLRFALELQLQIKLFEIFDWTEGEYVFRDDVPAPGEVVGLGLSAAQLVLEGIRRHYRRDRLEAQLRPMLAEYPELAPEPERRFQELGLGPAEERLVFAMDGRTSLAEVLTQPPPGLDAHGARAVALALIAMGVIVMKPRAERMRTVPPLPAAEDGAPEEVLAGDTVPTVRADGGDSGLGDAELAAFLAERRARDPFGVLGLGPGASPSDIDRAYGQLARVLHPDRFRARAQGTQAMAAEAFALLGKAHDTLADPRTRRQAIKRAAPTAPPPATTVPSLAPIEALIEEATDPVSPSLDPAARALAADRLFREGETRLKARDYTQAEWLFEQATSLRPDLALYLAYHAWSYFLAKSKIGSGKTPVDPDGVARAAADHAAPLLRQAVTLDPSLEAPHLFLGLMWAALGEDDLAEPELERAVHSNPDSSEALRELRRIHARRPG